MKKKFLPPGAAKYFAANPNVLVVEDDRFMGYVFLNILDEAGFQVTLVHNGLTALKKLQQQPVDFIILDILLPFMSGFEFYQQLQTDSSLKEIPVLIVTAWADTANFYRATQLGIRHFLAKPFTEDELLEEILALLKDYRPLR